MLYFIERIGHFTLVEPYYIDCFGKPDYFRVCKFEYLLYRSYVAQPFVYKFSVFVLRMNVRVKALDPSYLGYDSLNISVIKIFN